MKFITSALLSGVALLSLGLTGCADDPSEDNIAGCEAYETKYNEEVKECLGDDYMDTLAINLMCQSTYENFDCDISEYWECMTENFECKPGADGMPGTFDTQGQSACVAKSTCS